MGQSKFLIRFLNRAARFDADIEFVDVVARAVKNGHLHTQKDKTIFALVQPSRHPRLAKHKASDHNRGLVVSHLKRTVYAAYIKDLYEDLSEYAASLLGSAAKRGLDPGRLIGEHKITLDANELLRCGSWDAVVGLVSQNLFRRLENERSTKKLLDALDKKLALGADTGLVAAALPYLDARHLLVHADGIVDTEFVQSHPSFGAVAGEQLDVGWQLVSAARRHIVALVKHYDTQALSAGVVFSEDVQP